MQPAFVELSVCNTVLVAMQDPRITQVASQTASLAITADLQTMAAAQIDAACRRVAVGRIAANQLAVHAKMSGLTEAEFRLLWLLHTACRPQSPSQTQPLFDQKTLSERLGLSPAQVSAVVECLRKENLLAGQTSPTDRRRKVWQLTSSGIAKIEHSLKKVVPSPDNCHALPTLRQGDAA